MGLGSQEQRVKTYFCSPRATKDKKTCAHIKVTLRDTDGKIHHLPDEPSVSGYLVGIGVSQYIHDNRPVKQIKIFLMDGDALFDISLNKDSMWGRFAANAILGTPNINTVKFRVYEKDGQAGMSTYINDQKPTSKWDWKEKLAPLVYEVEDPKDDTKMLKVYKKVDALIYDEWEKFIPVVAKMAAEKGLTIQAPEQSKAQSPTKDDGPSLQEEFNSMPDPRTARPFAPPDDCMPLPDDEMPF